MKKQNIWALTLFSLILVLSVYYITLPNEYDVVNIEEAKTTVKEVEENKVIETLKIESNENKTKKEKELHEILTKEDASKEEKNNAYEELKALNVLKSKEEELELKIKDKFNLDNYVEINDDQIKVVLIKNEHNEKMASEIMDFVQESFEEKKYITVKFEKE
jgi:stage III sporulation protein AH